MLSGARAVATARAVTEKGFYVGTHRLCSPASTLARVAPLLAGIGVTRVANLTGLDRIGLPVFAAYRPNSRSLAVHQGKGFDLAAARASAVMEAVEFWHAEHVLAPLLWARVGDLASRHQVADIDRLPRRRGCSGAVREPLLWIEGRDLMQGGVRWLPYELVHADYTLPRAPGCGLFHATTNGLAAGNHVREAECHALAEVIERDARALWWLLDDAAKQATRVDLASVDDAAARSVIDTCARAGCALAVWDIATDVGVPGFLCRIADRSGPAPGAAGFYGSGAHPERGIALLRALLEAAQSRLTTIAGARDDFRPGEYAHYASLEAESFARLDSEERAGRRFADAPCFVGDSFDADLGWMLQRLRAIGIEEVVSVELTRPELGVPVVRIVVPGLEGMHTKASYTPGARARSARGAPVSAIVFLGPSLPRPAASTLLTADYRPPAAQGDVLRAAQERPRAILLIDGVFSQVAAVWHREILWAMASGIHVFGAASMGALRAAELHGYGMVGHGAIFEAYRGGDLEDDDEVAVAHGPAELGFIASSEAMVNIRATLCAARTAGVIGAASLERLLRIGKGFHFADRSWAAVLERARAAAVEPAELDRLAAWLPHGKRDQKRADAIALLELVAGWLASDPAPKRADFEFEYTSQWHRALLEAGAVRSAGAIDAATATAVVEELKLAGGDLFETALNGAALRLLAWQQTAGEPAAAADALLAEAATFRHRRGLERADDFAAWLACNRLRVGDLRGLLEDELRLARTRRRIAADDADRLIDELRTRDALGPLLERAVAKAERLRETERSGCLAASLPDRELLAWFARSDPHQFCTREAQLEQRFPDVGELVRVLRREYLFRAATGLPEVTSVKVVENRR